VRTLFHRPVEGAIQQTLRMYGKPLTLDSLGNELAVLNSRPPEYFHAMLPTFLSHRLQTYFETPDNRWGLIEWLLDVTFPDEEEVLLRNFFGELETVLPLIEELRAVSITPTMSYSDAAVAVLAAAGKPLSHKVISYLIWRAQAETFDAQRCYVELLQETRVHLLSGNSLLLLQQVSELTVVLQKLSTLADAALGEEETWEGPYLATTEDLHEIHEYMAEHEQPEKLSDLVEAVLDYSRSSSRYPSVFDGLMAALATDDRFQLVGQQTWTLPDAIPQDALQVPEALLPETLDPSLLPDPEADAELEDEGLDDKLAVWVHDPRYEDFGGEHEVELSPDLMGSESVNETRIPLLYDHREMGTLKLRQADMAFFPTDTPLACVTAHGENFGAFRMWINSEELLIHGLSDWYDMRDVPVGAVLTIRRGNEPDDYIIAWDGEIDQLIALSDERVETLLALHAPAEDEHWSISEIMRHALAGHGVEGVHFLTLWAEINVVRRTPKRVIASNLSSYHCFVPVTGAERWRLDERKVEQGRKKTKKKFIIE